MRKTNSREPNIERLLTAFRCEEPDCVPFFELCIHKKHVNHLLGRPAIRGDGQPMSDIEYTTFGLLSPEDHLELCRRIGQDCMGVIGFAPRDLRISGMDGEIKIMQSYSMIDGMFNPRSRRIGNVRDWDVLERLLPYSYEAQLLPKLKWLERYINAAKDTDIGVFYLSGSFWQDSHLASGFNNFMTKIYKDREFVKKLIAFFAKYYVWEALEVSRYPLAFYYFADNIAYNSGPFTRPEVFKELWLPWVKKIIEPFRSKEIPIVFNSDGLIDWILPEIVNLGFCAVNPLETPPNDIYAIKKEYGDKLCLIGNIDLAGSLGFGTSTEVMEDVRKHIRRLAPGGGYVVASSHDIGEQVPEENFVAMVEATHRYGAYPIV